MDPKTNSEPAKGALESAPSIANKQLDTPSQDALSQVTSFQGTPLEVPIEDAPAQGTFAQDAFAQELHAQDVLTQAMLAQGVPAESRETPDQFPLEVASSGTLTKSKSPKDDPKTGILPQVTSPTANASQTTTQKGPSGQGTTTTLMGTIANEIGMLVSELHQNHLNIAWEAARSLRCFNPSEEDLQRAVEEEALALTESLIKNFQNYAMGRSKIAKVSSMSIMKRMMSYAQEPSLSTQVKPKTRKKKQK